MVLVPTPIGNLGDVTVRALEVLRAADRIACEDTRRTGILLAHYEIERKVLTSLNEQNEGRKSVEMAAAAKDGGLIAFVSDAGMPGISDPGYRLVRACVEMGVPFEVLPGPSAVLTALIGSGFPCHAFRFGGFLSVKAGKRKTAMVEGLVSGETSIFFESPHRIVSTLRILEECAPDADVCVARELTKKFETYHRGKAGDLVKWFEQNGTKGEMVLVLSAGGRR